MKNKGIQLLVAAAFLLSSCGGDPASEVCDCYNDVAEMEANDPDRAKAQEDCMNLLNENYEQVKDDAVKTQEFQDKMRECENIKKLDKTTRPE
ncbi:MAG: hypothetical protein ACHQF2_00455 [Flavobacteriales bacterium]